MVGIAGFEPAAFPSQAGRSTKLSYTPIVISSMISVTHLSPRGGSYYERPEAVGFEPTDAGIKTLCLTTWRRPNNKQDIFYKSLIA